MFTNTLSNEEVTKIKVVDSDEFNNFYVNDFSSEIIEGFKILFEVIVY